MSTSYPFSGGRLFATPDQATAENADDAVRKADSSSRHGPRSLFPYTGGKTLLIPRLNAVIEDAVASYGLSDYREWTGGSGKVMLNLPEGLFEQYWYNDIDQGVVDVMTAVGDHRYWNCQI